MILETPSARFWLSIELMLCSMGQDNNTLSDLDFRGPVLLTGLVSQFDVGQVTSSSSSAKDSTRGEGSNNDTTLVMTLRDRHILAIENTDSITWRQMLNQQYCASSHAQAQAGGGCQV